VVVRAADQVRADAVVGDMIGGMQITNPGLMDVASSMNRWFSMITHFTPILLIIVLMQSIRTGQPLAHGRSSCCAHDIPERTEKSRILSALIEEARQCSI
jgi:hypothetical protein